MVSSLVFQIVLQASREERNQNSLIIFATKTYGVGTQNNRLNETVLLSTQNICLKRRVRKYSQFYAHYFHLSDPMDR